MKLSQIRLLVDDMEACRDFYRDVLGLEETIEVEDGSYAQFVKEGVFLGLYRRDLMADVLGQEEAGNGSKRDAVLIGFQVEDVDTAAEELQAKGVELVTEPRDQSAWFMRVAHLRDPEGNLIEIFSPLAMEEEA